MDPLIHFACDVKTHLAAADSSESLALDSLAPSIASRVSVLVECCLRDLQFGSAGAFIPAQRSLIYYF